MITFNGATGKRGRRTRCPASRALHCGRPPAPPLVRTLDGLTMTIWLCCSRLTSGCMPPYAWEGGSDRRPGTEGPELLGERTQAHWTRCSKLPCCGHPEAECLSQ